MSIQSEQPLREIGDIVHVLFRHPFLEDEWRPAQVVSVEGHKIGVQFHKTGEVMVLHRYDHGRIWK